MNPTRNSEFEKYDWTHDAIGTLEDFEPLRPLEIMLLQDLRKEHKQGTLLEIGCCYGRASLRFAQEGLKVVGIDTNASAIKKFNRFAGKMRLDAIAYCKDVQDYNLEDKSWDIIICEYTLHCLPKEYGEQLLHQIQRATKVGGYSLILLFTSEGNAFKSDVLNTNFHPLPRYLQAVYTIPDWTILQFQEDQEKTKIGPLQTASKILAKRLR